MSDGIDSPLDERAIERHVHRSRRWRYPNWQEWIELSRIGGSRQTAVESVDEREFPGQASSHKIMLAHCPSLQSRSSVPGWVVSAVIHGLLLACLALVFLVETSPERGDILVVSEAAPGGAELPTLLSPTPLPEPWKQRPDKAEKEWSASAVTGEPPTLPRLRPAVGSDTGLVGEVQALFGAGGAGKSAGPAAEMRSADAYFFGVPASGSRFVFVVDSSRSMMGADFSGRPWDDARRELQTAIARLGTERQFYVIFFDGAAHLMFDETAETMRMAWATPENVERFGQWMKGVETGFNTRPLEAIKCALKFRPDVIYLLSDGEFRDQTARYLKHNNPIRNRTRERLPASIVHTIGFHKHAAQRVLRNIAKSNGGTYKFIPDPVAAARLTRNR